MIAIDGMLQQPVARAIGWALLQFVWQGALITLLTAALLAALRRSGSDVRYVVSTISLALMLTMPVVTVWQSLADGSRDTPPFAAESATIAARDVVPAGASAPGGSMPAVTAAIPLTASAWPVEEWLPALVSMWLAGVVLLTLRLFSGWIWVQRMKSHGTRPAPPALNAAGQRLLRILHISRPVQFLESSRVTVPTVIGWLKPVVLLPASALAGLTPDQLEAILAHELAHIRRHDYLVNLLQTVVETLLFYHPGVWWVSRRIRIERENCCDDLAVSLCGDPVAYAAALAELEGLRPASGTLVLAATGGSLLMRVRRVLGAPTHAGRAPGWLAAGLALLVVVCMSASALTSGALTGEQIEPASPAPVAPVAPAAPAAPVTPAIDPAPMPAAPAPVAPITMEPRSREEAIAVAAVPVVNAVAASASLQTATTSQRTSSEQEKEKSGNFVWSDNGQRFEVTYRGDIEFTSDDTDVSRMSPGGFLRIKDGRRFGTDNAIEFRADSSGNVERRFWVGSTERPFDGEGRKWLAQMLPKFIRQSGIGAASRVARFAKAGGPPAVLAEITRIEGSWAKRIYFNELFKQPGLTTANIQQALAQAGREIDSDFELASLLITSNALIADDGARRAYLDATRSIESDFETRRVLSAIVKAGQMRSDIAASLLDASTSIDSDFEQATLLIEFVKQQPLDAAVRAAFFKALNMVGSAFERRRVLSATLQRTDLSPEARGAALESAAGVESDFERASFLVQFVNDAGVEGPARAPFFRAVSSIDSSFERGRVLQALAKRTDLSDSTVVEVLRSAQTMSSGYERAQVLLAVASGHQLTREGRDAYIDAAEKLGDYEQGRVLTALVRNERRK